MKALVFLLAGFLCASCATVGENVAQEQTEDSSIFASVKKLPRPDWADKEYWEERKALYAVGKATREEVNDEEIRLRIAELDAKEQMMRHSGYCRVTLVGFIPVKYWADKNGTVYVLAQADSVIPQKKC